MKRFFNKMLISLLSLSSGSVMAHSGHGDHSQIILSGQAHPVISIEHLLLLSVVGLAAYLVFKNT